MPYAGDALVEVQRVDGVITVDWDGTTLLSAPLESSIHSVQIEFAYYAMDHPYGESFDSFFGTEAVDMISIVPEPATMSLLALGGVALLKRRNK